MKKSLLALAVVGSFAASAQAQNVSLYGTLGFGTSSTDTSTTAQSWNNTDNRSSHVIGLKGAEDLGGGMKIGFVLEGDFFSNSGAFSSTTGNELFNRKSYVELSSGLGTIQLGRIYTVTEQVEGFSGMGYNLFDVSTEGSVGGKLSNAAAYTSPELIKGLKVIASSNHGNNTAGTTATATGNHVGYGFVYANGPLSLSAASEKQNISASSMDDEATFYNIGYVMGAFDFRLGFQNAKAQNVDSDMAAFGVNYDLGGGVVATAVYRNFTSSSNTANEYKLTGVAIQKALSKRTSIYAGYRNKDYSVTSNNETLATVGLDHSF